MDKLLAQAYGVEYNEFYAVSFEDMNTRALNLVIFDESETALKANILYQSIERSSSEDAYYLYEEVSHLEPRDQVSITPQDIEIEEDNNGRFILEGDNKFNIVNRRDYQIY